MIIKSIMLFLLIVAGLSLTFQGIIFLLSEFFWRNLFEVVSVFTIMVLFPALYFGRMIMNYRFWKFSEISEIIMQLKDNLTSISPGDKDMEVVKKGKKHFITHVAGVHTKFIFAFYRKDKLEISDADKLIMKAKEKQNQNILIFCTGTVPKEVKDIMKSFSLSLIIEDYRNIGDFNLKKYFTAPMKVKVKNKTA